MRVPMERVSRIERVASITVATGLTVAYALLVFASLLSRSNPVFVPSPRATPQTAENVEYVATGPMLTDGFTTAAAFPTLRLHTRRAIASAQHKGALTRIADTLGSAIGTRTLPADSPSGAAVPYARSRWTAMSPLLWADSTAAHGTTPRIATASGNPSKLAAWGAAREFVRRSYPPMRFDSALRAVHDNLADKLTGERLEKRPLTQTDRDSQSRAEALAAIAASGAGRPIARAMSGGGRIDAPLPFGGPSRKQRERDSTINAQTKENLTRVQQRLDSLAATRRRRYIDSLAQVEHLIAPLR